MDELVRRSATDKVLVSEVEVTALPFCHGESNFKKITGLGGVQKRLKEADCNGENMSQHKFAGPSG